MTKEDFVRRFKPMDRVMIISGSLKGHIDYFHSYTLSGRAMLNNISKSKRKLGFRTRQRSVKVIRKSFDESNLIHIDSNNNPVRNIYKIRHGKNVWRFYSTTHKLTTGDQFSWIEHSRRRIQKYNMAKEMIGF